MLPSLVRVAVPPVELRITPAAGRAKNVLEPTPVTPACHPPIYRYALRNVDRHVTARGPVTGTPLLIALIPVLNCPVVETLLNALTSTVPVVEAAQMPCASAPCVVIAPDAVTMMFPPGPSRRPLRRIAYSAAVGDDAERFGAACRDRPRRSYRDAAAVDAGAAAVAGKSKDAEALPALGRNAGAGVIHEDWRGIRRICSAPECRLGRW